ncbi:slit homolog 2 protein-like [Magallana gigas]|uniref:slit homolog 2 protein-like n=1 Tax=Magallana gigas TaxID=29159 RepID=UPI003340CEB5
MLGFQCLLLCTVLYSATVDAFGECDDDGSCPDNATCEGDTSGGSQCECKDGFDEIDVPGLTIGGTPMTVCVDFGVCSPFDNFVDDCLNGQCVLYKDRYESYQAECKCDNGYFGEKCDRLIQQSGSGIIRGGVVLLSLLAGGAAFLPALM